MNDLIFSVPGTPVPQPRPRVTTQGGYARAYTPSDHPINAYRKAIESAARAAGAVPINDAPLVLEVDLVFPRPKSHLTKSGVKSTAPQLPRCDVSNCLKGIEDALNGVAYVDDSQIGLVVARKSWGTEPRTAVRIKVAS